MFPMKEKSMSTKRAASPCGRSDEDGKRKEAEPRPDTGRRIRKIAERHKETLDYLAER
jgi:hypothetical protein